MIAGRASHRGRPEAFQRLGVLVVCARLAANRRGKQDRNKNDQSSAESRPVEIENGKVSAGGPADPSSAAAWVIHVSCGVAPRVKSGVRPKGRAIHIARIAF